MNQPEPLGMPFTETAIEGLAPTEAKARAPTASDSPNKVAILIAPWEAGSTGQDSQQG